MGFWVSPAERVLRVGVFARWFGEDAYIANGEMWAWLRRLWVGEVIDIVHEEVVGEGIVGNESVERRETR